MSTINTLFGAAGVLTKREAERYSISDLIDAAATNDRSRLAFYDEVSAAVAAKHPGLQPSTVRSYFVPADVMTRNLTAGVPAQGGYLVDTTNAAFGDMLFGADVLSLPMTKIAMAGNAQIPVVSSASAAWLANEGTEYSGADPVFAQRGLTPKTVSTVVTMSRAFDKQSRDGGMQLVQRQLVEKVRETVGTAVIAGTGGAQPTGLLSVSGTASTSGSTLGWNGITDLLNAVEGYSTDDLVFVVGVNAARLLRRREKAAGSGVILDAGQIGGIRCLVSRCCPTDALVLASWPNVVFASFGPLELTVVNNATSAQFLAGQIGVRVMWSVDVSVIQPGVVGKSTSIT
jgi:HK97 family phage major capsid protein